MRAAVLCGLLALCAHGEAAAQGATERRALSAAEARMREQDEKIERLLLRVGRQDEQIARLRAAPRTPSDASLPEASSTVLRLSGFVQTDAVLYRQSSEDEVSGAGAEPLNEDRFLIRRARLRTDVRRGIFQGGLEIDANTVNGPTARILGADVSVRWQGPGRAELPLLSASIGLLKIPFGVEVPEAETARLFLERSAAARAFFPGSYDLGFRLQGGYRFVRYALSLMNGEPLGEKSFPGRDPNAGKDFVGRLGIDTAITEAVRVQAGASVLSGQGFHKGTPSTKDVLVWRDANENGLVEISEVQAIPGASATPSMSFHRFAIGGDIRLSAALPVLGELCVHGEIARAQDLDRGLEPADPVGAGRSHREFGFHVGLTQEITRYAMIGVRYERYDPDADASEQRGAKRVPRDSTYATLALAAALRYAPARLVLEYDHNQNALGRTQGGLPTTLGDDALTLRAEVTF